MSTHSWNPPNCCRHDSDRLHATHVGLEGLEHAGPAAGAVSHFGRPLARMRHADQRVRRLSVSRTVIVEQALHECQRKIVLLDRKALWRCIWRRSRRPSVHHNVRRLPLMIRVVAAEPAPHRVVAQPQSALLHVLHALIARPATHPLQTRSLATLRSFFSSVRPSVGIHSSSALSGGHGTHPPRAAIAAFTRAACIAVSHSRDGVQQQLSWSASCAYRRVRVSDAFTMGLSTGPHTCPASGTDMSPQICWKLYSLLAVRREWRLVLVERTAGQALAQGGHVGRAAVPQIGQHRAHGIRGRAAPPRLHHVLARHLSTRQQNDVTRKGHLQHRGRLAGKQRRIRQQRLARHHRIRACDAVGDARARGAGTRVLQAVLGVGKRQDAAVGNHRHRQRGPARV